MALQERTNLNRLNHLAQRAAVLETQRVNENLPAAERTPETIHRQFAAQEDFNHNLIREVRTLRATVEIQNQRARQNGWTTSDHVTADLLSELDGLRAQNEHLRQVEEWHEVERERVRWFFERQCDYIKKLEGQNKKLIRKYHEHKKHISIINRQLIHLDIENSRYSETNSKFEADLATAKRERDSAQRQVEILEKVIAAKDVHQQKIAMEEDDNQEHDAKLFITDMDIDNVAQVSTQIETTSSPTSSSSTSSNNSEISNWTLNSNGELTTESTIKHDFSVQGHISAKFESLRDDITFRDVKLSSRLEQLQKRARNPYASGFPVIDDAVTELQCLRQCVARQQNDVDSMEKEIFQFRDENETGDVRNAVMIILRLQMVINEHRSALDKVEEVLRRL